MLALSALFWLITELTCDAAPARQSVTFAADVQPILERRCTPCHFPGGVMYAKLPFDQPRTIEKLGTKLFTRIKAEDEQKVIRAFLAGSSAVPAAEPAAGTNGGRSGHRSTRAATARAKPGSR